MARLVLLRERIRKDQQGALLEMFALSLVFIVLLGIAWTIDNPTTQAAAAKAQHAADVGTIHGVNSFHSYENAARSALGNAIAVMSNNYGAGGIGRFSDDFTGNPTLRVAIPRYQRPGDNSGGAAGGAAIFDATYLDTPVFPGPAQLDTGNSGSIYNSVIDPLVSGFRINDFKNAVFFYARVTPNRFLRVIPRAGLQLSLGQVEVASLAMLKTVMSYVLIDPAFSMEGDAGNNNLNLAHIFPPADGATPDPTQDWPTRGGLRLSGGELSSVDPLDYFPSSGDDVFTTKPLGVDSLGLDAVHQQNVYRTYSALCDSLPFAFFKETAVNLLDWFTGSSAFNHTTLVGLTGYAPIDSSATGLPVVGLFPSATVSAPQFAASETHPFDPSKFPLAKLPNAERSNKGLHEARPVSLRGYVNTKNLDRDANSFSVPKQTVAGVNDWSLCYCRKLYSAAGGAFRDYQLPEDHTWFNNDETAIHHFAPESRVRDDVGGANWCDDFVAPGAARDTTINYNNARNGAGEETVRNIVGGLGMRVNDVNASLQVLNDTPAAWNYPTVSTAFDGHGQLETGYRDIAASMVQIGPSGISEPCSVGATFSNSPTKCGALNFLLQASNDYQADSTYGTARPVGKRALIVLGFGLWSRSAYEYEKARRGGVLTLATYEQERLDALRNALSEAVCRHRVGVHMAFLPLDNWDKNTVVRAQDVVKDFEALFRYQQEGGSAPTPPPGCAVNTPVAPVWFAIVNHEDFPGGDDRTRKLQAASYFRKTMVTNITQALLEWQFPL